VRASAAAETEPDWERLEALGAEIKKLKAADQWDKEAFDRIYAEGVKAANGHGEFLEFIANQADEDWL
jgi:hypothetical protein